ncbi:class I SAM-dependent methyltransferase [Aquicella lusitana]|uniref:Methyltransferase family protein n=1 Tax=Aquicella lusitana TaxID=254246 RepID=A0A370GKY2_9COXI|nr:class I SAM-dependent methyltransferase [Aquicella lusitana]RDI42543.1 methyltransferase family protein [Aquicella lusitana]VVC74322.1 putative methyltransferase [Aquicella lusitana]
MKYTDHFGEKSAEYRQFRPDYPKELYDYLSGIVHEHELAWDCGTGNGQAAIMLAACFDDVIATDINQAQLDAAIKKKNIQYRCCPAEKTDINASTVDLITVAQALHWFNLESFYNEAKRVLKPEGIIAAWCYSLGKINPEIDAKIEKLYSGILGEYWPKERRYIDEQYRTIHFPFEKLQAPYFTMDKTMNLNQLVGYLNTWSAVKEYQKRKHKNPIDFIINDIKKIWGDHGNERTMHWPLHLLLGKVIK